LLPFFAGDGEDGSEDDVGFMLFSNVGKKKKEEEKREREDDRDV